MIDLETLGTKHKAVVLSIAAVVFDLETGATGAEFKVDIDVLDSLQNGYVVESETYQWWLRQSKEAHSSLIEGQKKALSIDDAVIKLLVFVLDNFDSKSSCYPWGNSARFDLGLLEMLFHNESVELPWKHSNERDVRTLVALNPEIKANTPFEGVRHTPIDDCKHQIKYCHHTYKSLHL